MFRLTDIMLQNFEKDLHKFHELFQGGRCQAWQLEELIAKSINSDFNYKDKAFWTGNGHDIDADIIVGDYKISVKSGKIKKATKQNPERLILSGHRLGRFDGKLDKITDFLNTNKYLLVAVPYYEKHCKHGKQHNYQILYIDANILKPNALTWNIQYSKKSSTKITKYILTNEYGVCLSLNPSMSWQVWWEIPLSIISEENKTRMIVID